MSWGRTVLALNVLSLMLLRWYPAVGLWALSPAVTAVVGGVAIMFSQKRRYEVQSSGVTRERVRPSIGAVTAIVALVTALAALSISANLLAAR